MQLVFVTILLLINLASANGQGRAANWLLGYTTAVVGIGDSSRRAILHFDRLNVNISATSFQMPFRASQSSISDESGALIFYSNGCDIADSTGQQMMNGNNLINGPNWSTWCTSYTEIPFNQSNIALPDPGNSSRYYLIHQSSLTTSSFATDLFYTAVDMSLNNGLGAVPPNEKNVQLFSANQNNNVIACKHANGRDWWIVTFEHMTDSVFVMLLTPSGFSGPFKQSLGFTLGTNEISQSQFSPDGKKFAYARMDYQNGLWPISVRLFDFDRCSGQFSNGYAYNYVDSNFTLGLMFSGNSKRLYVASTLLMYQFDVDNFANTSQLDTVAVNDQYYSPFPPFMTTFWLLYRAANGKIYGSSGNGVLDLHYINYPDSTGIACDVRQHALHLPCFAARSNVNHPNYYLGCDSTLGCPCLISTGLDEFGQHDFKVQLSPNPGKQGFELLYLLPQNQSGELLVYDLQGRVVYRQILPPWSTMQSISAFNWIEGIYQVRISSKGYSVTKKWVKM